MPVTLVDRLPLPNLKVYTAGSVLLLSVAVYYALSVTSDPSWRANATLQRQEAMAGAGDAEVARMVQPVVALNDSANATRNISDHFVEVMTFMMQEPLCMWTVINIAYCALALFGFVLQRAVFGRLRVAEAQRVKDKLWNYIFYKFIFVFGVINVQYMDEVLLWCSWFTAIGFLHLLGQLCKDRFEYLSSSPNTCKWAHARLLVLLGWILVACLGLLAAAVAWGLPAGKDTFAFMAAECLLVLVSALHVVARYALQAREADAAGPLAYYTHLLFDSVSLVVELLHVVHMVVYSNMLVSMASLVLLMQLRHLLHELQARLRRHRLYTALAHHMSRNYPMASKEEVEKNQDNCAICWEPMKEARKLPCSHLFHNSCLCQWVQQDASCPTCRRALAAGTLAAPPGPPALPDAHAHAHAHALPHTLPHAHAHTLPHAPLQTPPAAQPNHLFHFDGSRYVSWLPSFSVEVTRVRMEPPAASQVDAMVRQVQAMFPQYPAGLLAAELAVTRSPALTIDNILEGRLPPLQHAPEVVEPPAPTAAAAAPAVTRAAPASHDSDPQLATTSHDDLTEVGPVCGGFPRDTAEREVMLRRRKELLVAAARRRYIARFRSDAAGVSGGSDAADAPLASDTTDAPDAPDTRPHS